MTKEVIRHLWLILLLLACQPDKPARTAAETAAFYHWKTGFDPTPSERKMLDSLGVNKLYIRFFDVDWGDARRQPVPKATVVFRQEPAAATVVPVVYITNRTLAQLRPADVPALAKNLSQKISQIADKQRVKFSETQIDCDWTRTTRGVYFALLRAIAGELKRPLSATIRLHQIKFAAQTGVPPVGRGMLMAYNTGDWKRADTRNSILDLADLKAYAGHLPGYPLPLDVALPIFRWAVVYRNGRFLTLLNGVDAARVQAVPALAQQTDTTRYVALRDTPALGTLLRRGDLLRVETCTLEQLRAAKAMLTAQLPDQKCTFTLYHLDSTLLRAYPHVQLRTLLPAP